MTIVELIDLIRSKGMRCSVEAGERRLNAAVQWVHIFEALDVAENLHGGEFLLTTGYQLHNHSDAELEGFARSLQDAGAVGIGLETNPSDIGLTERLRRIAVDIDMPLISFPEPVPFLEITLHTHRHLLAKESEKLRRSMNVQRQLRTAAIEGLAPTGILQEFVTEFPGEMLYTDGSGVEIACAPNDEPSQEFLEEITETKSSRLVTRPVVIAGATVGRLYFLARAPSTDIDLAAVDQAAFVLALASPDVLTSHKNAQEKLVDRIAAGRVAGGHDLERRTERLGLNFDARHTVVICLRGVLGTGNGHQPLQAVAPVDRLKLAFELSCEELRLPMISQTGRTLRVRGVVGLSTAEDVETLQRLGILIRQKLSGIGHGVRLAAIGLARHGDQPWELREAFEGAQRAALVSEVVGGAARWADKLGSLGILAEGVTHSDEVSRPLINDETAKFLQAMLESGWNKAYAATSLHVQRQTIYRRLESISSSVGLDLQTPEGQLEASLLFWSHRISKLVSADGNRWLPPC